jgi:tripartite ATP-independent transporter DctM subunit
MLIAVWICLGVLLLLGVPLFALFGGSALGLFMSREEGAWASAGIDALGSSFAESPFLMTIPMFTFAGYVLAESRAPLRLIRLSRAWLGWLPGSLAVVCLTSSVFFATVTGGSAVTIIAVGGLAYPALLREKYPESFAIGMITTAGALGALFPPSMLLIFYCIVARVPVEKALVAGIFAGLLTMLVLIAYSAYVGVRAGVPRAPFVLRAALRELWIAKWEIAIPVVLVATIASGLLRLQEASAFIALYVLAIEVLVYGDLDIRRDLPRIVVDSMTMLGAVMIILMTAIGFTSWTIQAHIPTDLFDWMEAHITTPWAFLLALNVFLVAVGMLTDGLAAIIVVAPLVVPLAAAYGIDPYHLAVIFLLNLEIGFVVPPVGMNLFVSSLRFGRSLGYVCRSVVPFVAALLLVLALVTAVPWLSTYLPSLITTRVIELDFLSRPAE